MSLRNAATERLDPLYVAVADRFGMVNDETGFERLAAVYPFKDREEPIDAFVVGGMDPERPLVDGQQFYDRLQLVFHCGGEVWPRLQEVLEISCRPS